MTAQPKILLLCHHRIAMPVMRQLWEEGVLAGVAVPELYDFIHQPFQEISRQMGIPFTSLHKATYRETLLALTDGLRPDAVFVISFPWLVTNDLLEQTRYGYLNFHGGLLPEMRGSDPMFECIRKAIPVTGVTVHRMDEGMDTGPVLLQEQIETGPDMTHGMLSSQLSYACERLSRQLVEEIRAGKDLAGTPQDEDKAYYIPRPGPQDTCINWQEMTAPEIRALVNACNPQLKGATATYNGWNFGITHVTEINFTDDDGRITPGTVLYADPQQGLIIYCKGGKGLRIDIAYTEEGYFPGYKLAMYGLAHGIQLHNPLVPAAAPAI